jgi:hypothetical protein
MLERRLDVQERQLAESGYEFSKEDVWKEIEITTRIREKVSKQESTGSALKQEDSRRSALLCRINLFGTIESS